MQVNTAVKLVLVGVEAHEVSSSLVSGSFPDASIPLGYAEGEASIIINGMQRTRHTAAAPLSVGRVCRTWHSASGVKVPVPDVRGGEGKGVTVRWGLKEPQPNDAGRRTGTGEEVWDARDEWARDHEVLHPRWGVLDTSGVHASKGRCLTPGGLHGVHVEGMDAIGWHRQETRRQQRTHTSACSHEKDCEGREPI
jgi:hypothetical protein